MEHTSLSPFTEGKKDKWFSPYFLIIQTLPNKQQYTDLCCLMYVTLPEILCFFSILKKDNPVEPTLYYKMSLQNWVAPKKANTFNNLQNKNTQIKTKMTNC